MSTVEQIAKIIYEEEARVKMGAPSELVTRIHTEIIAKIEEERDQTYSDLHKSFMSAFSRAEAAERRLAEVESLHKAAFSAEEAFRGALKLAENDVTDLQSRLAASEKERNIGKSNYANAWTALRMIREAVEYVGYPGGLPSEEAVLGLSGPEPVHEAEHIVKAITAIGERLSASEERARVLKEALRPFALDAVGVERKCERLGICDLPIYHTATLADYRRARELVGGGDAKNP